MAESYEVVELKAETSGERLDKYLAACVDYLSRAQIQALIRQGLVTVNGGLAKASLRLEGGEVIRLLVPPLEAPAEPEPETIPLQVLYEDEHVAVVDKPAGMVVHPAFGHQSGTLVNAVLARWPQIADFAEPGRAGIVHRLDKDTSGVILIAKTPLALNSLRAQFKARQVQKRYLALVEGVPGTTEGVIDAPIGRDPKRRKQMAVLREGREAITEFRVVEIFPTHSLLEVWPKTGRTHQIRVHLAFIGHPVVGDTVYGRRKQTLKLSRHFLHAASVNFAIPGTEQRVTVESPLPSSLQNILNALRR
ncbi:MAG: RluA family pseudouridine synthase [Anaerolineae bacterium]